MKKLHPTILVIDDGEEDQFLIRYTLKKIGVRSNLLSDEVEAIAYMMGEGKYADRSKKRRLPSNGVSKKQSGVVRDSDHRLFRLVRKEKPPILQAA